MIDWRAPQHRREAFQRLYSFHLKYRTHPGCVYFWLPALAEAHDLDEDGRAWLVWLNGNTQNPVMSHLLLEASGGRPERWREAVAFWNDNFKAMDWDTDRRHQKGKFGEATEKWWETFGASGIYSVAERWHNVGTFGWDATWAHAKAHPYMGRLSAWSMTEYARILLGAEVVPDAASFMMGDLKGSASHRNGAMVVGGHDAVYWKPERYDRDLVGEANAVAETLLTRALERNPGHPDVSRLTLESALCTFKSMWKPDRRYPNVYADMAHGRLLKAESRFGKRFEVLWAARREALPPELRLEDNPTDPGLVPAKQNLFRETGQIPMLHVDWPEMTSDFDRGVAAGTYGRREDAR